MSPTARLSNSFFEGWSGADQRHFALRLRVVERSAGPLVLLHQYHSSFIILDWSTSPFFSPSFSLSSSFFFLYILLLFFLFEFKCKPGSLGFLSIVVKQAAVIVLLEIWRLISNKLSRLKTIEPSKLGGNLHRSLIDYRWVAAVAWSDSCCLLIHPYDCVLRLFYSCLCFTVFINHAYSIAGCLLPRRMKMFKCSSYSHKAPDSAFSLLTFINQNIAFIF